jgi:hypothetical protein
VVGSCAVSRQEAISRLFAALLLRGVQPTLSELAEQGKRVQHLYATSRTRDGTYRAQRMGFALLPHSSTDHRKAFGLDLV